ncbi:MAG: hypothetical protein OEO23_07550, partial [Gemmatimonadota bacterium]|nr:hypothetical protein [Gemmatimonadota bacterium]
MRMRQRDRGVNRGASPGKARLRRGLSACLGPWVAFAAAGCGGGDETLAGAAGVRRLSSDLVHVVGTSDSIAAVKDLQVPSDGSVWVLSTQAPHFVGFRSNGELIAAHGGAGGGPEEFAAPAAFVTGWDDEAWVFDYRRHGLIHVSRPEGLWTESTLPRDVLPPGTLVGGMGMMEI